MVDKTLNVREVSALFNVPTHVLRYWETEFPELAPRLDDAGRRSYDERAIRIVRRIRGMLYEERRTIAQTKALIADEKF